jgi:pilus assembly protein CpaB
MFRRQSLLVMGVAVLLGLVAVYLVNAYLTGATRQQEARTVQTTRIAVARVPLNFGTRITPQNVQFIDWPVNSVPQGAFRSPEELTPAGNSHVVLRPMIPGEPVLKSRLSGEGGRATLSALLPPDMRAASIRITDVSSVAGFALPGDRVDVLMTREMGEERVTEMLLQNVRLIAIDQSANENTAAPSIGRTATLEVNADDAQKLALGAAVGQLSLVLRSVQAPQDAIQYSAAMRSSDLEGGVYRPQVAQAAAPQTGPRATRPAQPVRRGINVEVVRGTVSSDYEVRPYGGS